MKLSGKYLKANLVLACLALALVTPVAQAATISIDDSTDGLKLFVLSAGLATTPNILNAGTGNQIDITTPTNSNLISQIVYNAATESLSFKFDDTLPWSSNVFLFRNYSEAGGGLSDLFVIQGLAGTNPDYITFNSDPGSLDPTSVRPITNNTATPSDLGIALETGSYQLAFDTGPDQYYIRSDVDTPEPTTLTLLGIGIAGMAGYGWRRRKTAAA